MKEQKTDESKSQADSAESAVDDTDSDTVDEYIHPRINQDYTKSESPMSKNDNLHSLAKIVIIPEYWIELLLLLATSVLHDLGLVSPIDQAIVIDGNKICRKCSKTCGELQ